MESGWRAYEGQSGHRGRHWTFFGGLASSFVREKSGSIAAPALLHGLPQAIASALPGL